MTYELTPKQQAMLTQPFASDEASPELETYELVGGYDKTLRFHEAVNLPIRYDWRYIPPVSERLLRGKLLLEEVLETLKAMGLTLSMLPYDPGASDGDDVVDRIEVTHIEGSIYDPIETADGLADIKVIANGTALCFGIPMKAVDNEVWASNMSKLDEDGNPIVNRCTRWVHEADLEPATEEMTRSWCRHQLNGNDDCSDPSHLIDPSQPVGKVLKPSTYKKANIARLYYESTTGFGD